MAEVLITLVIIGVIAAITIPSIIQSTQEKELESKAKKAYSTIRNALLSAQNAENCIGDNSCVFGQHNNYLDAANYFSKYLNTMKICEDPSDAKCKDSYYPINYYTKFGTGIDTNTSSLPQIILTDGTIIYLAARKDCINKFSAWTADENGNPKVDENGNTDVHEVQDIRCADLTFDVNGPKKPNKYGKDIFALLVLANDVKVNTWLPVGGDRLNKIILEKKN